MKKNLIYKEYEKYEILWEGKEQFDNSFKLFNEYSYSHRFKFENNYGASVIKHYGSYGFENDLFELAVLVFEDERDMIGHLSYNTPITDDVIGYLTNDEVLDLLNKIKNL